MRERFVNDRTYGVLILAGGEATRLPGKLALPAGDLPMVAHVYRTFASSPDRPSETFVSCNATFDARLDALLDAPAVVDRWTRRGPLGGMLSAFAQMRSRFVFAVAGDAPNVTRAFADAIFSALEPGDEAAVPVRRTPNEDAHLEPLAAVYDRLALIRVGMPILRSGRGSLGLALAELRTRRVRCEDGAVFANINTPGDYRRYRSQRSDAS